MPDDVARALALQGPAGAAARARLETYVAALAKWQKRINLIGPATVAEVWRRHVLDCGQLAALMPVPPVRVCDLGSGAGLPGLVLAAMGVGEGQGGGLDLVESDARKAAFLREANRLMGAHARILNRRIEEVAGREAAPYDVVTARALAPLPKLLDLAENLLKTGGKLLFLKGRGADAELTESEKTWKMRVTKTPSASDAEGVILLIEDLEKRHG
ncbi:MAG: 16S rRNA (guanine(527)-N(7))-methyltransferase RsmG [Rhodospirillales bacterium CG15_BIG_FIL_POST_REV_8_21_14_020_66_15]|nr:MAG: 16S rRNA (guanine(527)-N(7))-methyltransferase RsmG [Rhodospirillales bacterium CG15_BIG_FIL_POST_REV_8_21_14_020_66_15]